MKQAARTPLLPRRAQDPRGPVHFTLDGADVAGLEGDTVLVAVLSLGAQVREHEFSGQPHAGFCAIGACQDCWMDTADGQRLRACTTALVPGMNLLTRPPR